MDISPSNAKVKWTEQSSVQSVAAKLLPVRRKLAVSGTSRKTERSTVPILLLEGLHFYNCYAPPSLTLDELDGLPAQTDQGREAALSRGNCWGLQCLGSRQEQQRDQNKAANTIRGHVYTGRRLANVAEPTFVRGETSLIVDLEFVSSSLARGNYSREVIDIYTTSYHRAIFWEVFTSQRIRSTPEKTNEIGWKGSTFDPSLFVAALNDHPISDSSATENVEHFMRRVAKACDASMPRKRSGNRLPPVHWWNDEIATLREECGKARRSSKPSRKKGNPEKLKTKYKNARRKLNKAIKCSKRQCWTELFDEVEADAWDRPYRMVMTWLTKQPMPSLTCPKFLENIVVVLFLQQPELHQFTEQCAETSIPPITQEQLEEACSRVGNTMAPGVDGIPNIALKAAIRAAPGLFLDVYNAWLREGTSPAKWKQQRRIEATVQPLLADNQYGFRRGGSTLDGIDLVISTAKEAISATRLGEGTKKSCLVATLDINNAFNSAKWDCIMEALESMTVRGYLQRMVDSYFTERVLGPGSVLGPLLWNIMYDGLLKVALPSEARLVAFGDDLLWRIRQWMDSVSLHLAEYKTGSGTHQEQEKIGDNHTASRLNFKQQAEHVSTKASGVRASLSHIMPNMGRPKQKRRALLSPVVTVTCSRPVVDVWLNRSHGEVNYYLTQMLSRPGCFRAYVHKFKHEDFLECPACIGVNEDAEHVAFSCPRFSMIRDTCKSALGGTTRLDNLVEAMLFSKAGWDATSSYVAEVIKELRNEDRRRKLQDRR
ncbi:uncharacterized protein LOC107037455 [Diachasma alloeum]|uniref:uncharacterized protein LOC107037455 n=1 Tax=Diachasma alloeum TaxID=454923 RepID=UPI0007383C5B|nr:uncharacterized protein LOC107037455 [Diachasma alloeum]